MDIFSELRRRKDEGVLKILPVERSSTGRITTAILDLLKNEPLTILQVRMKLGLKPTSCYNAVRRLEKKEKIVAFNYGGEIVFIEKNKAKNESLI
ncbi:hypothetical protein HY993_03410 [Candidatus Micrarchaeota archaeon]|nr:hypothetical protein [Candidatus Micrarchaeota archaeon]